MSFSFDLDQLVFHPQSAHDCGWSAKIEGYYKVAIAMCSNVYTTKFIINAIMLYD